jgi:hypothetical protein
MKHIAIHYHFIQEKVDTREIELEYVLTNAQVADALTKALSREKHERFIGGMGIGVGY